MGRLMMFNRITPEGYFSAPDGNLNWAVPDDELDGAAAEKLQGTGTILFGRRTYEMFEGFWPKVLNQPGTAPDPHTPGRRSEALHAMAMWIEAAHKIVFSKTRNQTAWNNSELRSKLDAREIQALKEQAGRDMIVFGSGSLVSELSDLRLIDEYQFVVSPLLLGQGRPLFGERSQRLGLELVEAKATRAGNVLLRYRRRD